MNNQLNPDPQGGESNMSVSQKVRQDFPGANSRYFSNAQDAEQWWSIEVDDRVIGHGATEELAWLSVNAEGATAQPTTASTQEDDIRASNARQSELMRNFPDNYGGSVEDTEELPPRPETYTDRHAERIKPGEDAAAVRYIAALEARLHAQPVPSAGSKPPEEGGTPYTECPYCGGKWTRRESIKNCPMCETMIGRITPIVYNAASQPVADGGGAVGNETGPVRDLLNSMKVIDRSQRYMECRSDVLTKLMYQIASSQEALRAATVAHETAMYALGSELTALKERMQQAVKTLEESLKSIQHPDYVRRPFVLKAIELLSPEGSSR